MKEVSRQLFHRGTNNLVEDENTRTYTDDEKTFGSIEYAASQKRTRVTK
jgi:hypothetical protein